MTAYRASLINTSSVTALSALLYLASPGVVLRAEVHQVSNTRSFKSALFKAFDGDEIWLAPGTYSGRFDATRLVGVTIKSADVNHRAIIDAAGAGEGIKLSSATRVTISDLIIQNASENAISIDDNGFGAPSTNISLRNLLIRNGQGHGVKFAGVDRFSIEKLQIQDWGNGFAAINLLGAHDGSVASSLIQRTNTSGGFGVKVEAGSASVTIRANRFVDCGERAIQFGGGVRPDTFRPQPAGDVAARDLVAEGNVIVNRGADGGGIRAAVAFVNVSGSVFRNNLVYRPSVGVGSILKENPLPGFVDTQHGAFNNNIVVWHEGDVFTPRCFIIGPATLAQTFHFAGNSWFNVTKPTGSTLGLPATETDGKHGVDPNVNPDSVIPWRFRWGIWLVNATDQPQTYRLAESQSVQLATPNAGGELDLGRSDPLIGSWNLSPLKSPVVELDAFSYAVLIDASR
jgi:hypothetical protein